MGHLLIATAYYSWSTADLEPPQSPAFLTEMKTFQTLEYQVTFLIQYIRLNVVYIWDIMEKSTTRWTADMTYGQDVMFGCYFWAS